MVKSKRKGILDVTRKPLIDREGRVLGEFDPYAPMAEQQLEQAGCQRDL
ncbi:MAG: hypothetical protein JXA82_08800 [Sedimentisphaerales bacterium]|nr:hypothetical protein [Sedimentisphaerales bacterium]